MGMMSTTLEGYCSGSSAESDDRNIIVGLFMLEHNRLLD